jgi:hypothetical protein
MGEAKRRKLAGNYPLSNRAASGRGHARERLSPSESSVAALPHIPDDLRADIAQSVRGIEFRGFGGGTCFFRAAIGTAFLQYLDLPAQLALGGMLYRAGPDPCRDVVAYCGEGNVGQLIPGVGWIGHYWTELHGEVVDFSCGDWRKDTTPDMMLMADDMGPVQWNVEPPDFLWVSEASVAPIPGQYTPEIGRAYYTGWKGPTPPYEQSLKDLETAIDWQPIGRHFADCCQSHALKERVWAAQSGNVFLDLRGQM